MTNKQMMILHICENSLFLERAIKLFEKAYPGKNQFLVNSDFVLHKKFNYSKYNQVLITSFNGQIVQNLLDKAHDNFLLCIFHNIGLTYKLEVAKRLKGKIPLHGICWGWEIYDSPLLEKFLYQPETLKLKNKLYPTRKYGLKKRLKQVIKVLYKGKLYTNSHYKLFQLLDSYSTVIESEKTFMQRFYSYNTPYLRCGYTIGFSEDSPLKLRKDKSILVGNSASFENNHADILSYLRDVQHKTKNIIIPLSYGDNRYAVEIEKLYKEALTSKCIFLKEFISFDEYNAVVSECGFVIMNHIRQQAMGNVYSSLFEGAKLFLNKNSLAYKELKALGYVVYKLEDLETETDHLETNTIIKHNRTLVIKHRSFPAAEKKIRDLLDYHKLVN